MTISKQDIADHVNANFDTDITDWEKGILQSKLNPEVARIMIKILGDCAWLTWARDNASNNE
jgi:hypothetical protein